MKRYGFGLWMLLGALAAQGQQQDKHYIRASAEAAVTAQPDQAHISIGVQTQASSARVAAERNAKQTSEVLQSMKEVLTSKGRLQTSGYSISPHYENNQQKGYEVSNSVEVTLDDLRLLPQVIDTASDLGANNVGGVMFSVKDDSAFRMRALGDASKQARAAGEAMAQALNLRVTGVASAESGIGGGPIRPVMQAMEMKSRMVSTPIETGTVEIRATVTVTLEVAP